MTRDTTVREKSKILRKHANLFNLGDQHVMVVGGTGGIGGEVALACGHFGARVSIAGRSQERCGATATNLQTAGVAAVAGVQMDATCADSIAAGWTAAEQALGPVTVLVNSAGTQIEEPAVEVREASWDTVMDINFKGAFLLSQAAARHMIPRAAGGSIIHITSVRSNLGIRRGYAAYVGSKGGLGILIKQLASEWAAYSIRVNGIAPTFIRTPLVDRYLNDPEFYQALVTRIPMGRVGETEDLAGLAVFLASPASSFITGQNIFADGGVTACQ